MVKRNRFADVFLDEYSKELEQSTKRNIDRITNEIDLKKAHTKIVQILQNTKQFDNKYINYEIFSDLVRQLKIEKQAKAEKAQLSKTIEI